MGNVGDDAGRPLTGQPAGAPLGSSPQAVSSKAAHQAHTPGPWHVFDHFCGRDPEIAGEYADTRLVGLGQFSTIAEVRQGHDEIAGDVDANARLIAASPELLDALVELEDAVADGLCNSGIPDFDPDRLERARVNACAVIAKAKGRQS